MEHQCIANVSLKMHGVAVGQGVGHGMCSSLLEDHLIKLLHLGGAVLGSERPLLRWTVVHAFE